MCRQGMLRLWQGLTPSEGTQGEGRLMETQVIFALVSLAFAAAAIGFAAWAIVLSRRAMAVSDTPHHGDGEMMRIRLRLFIRRLLRPYRDWRARLNWARSPKLFVPSDAPDIGTALSMAKPGAGTIIVLQHPIGTETVR